MNNSRTQWIGWSAAVAIITLFAAANFLKIDTLWGFNLPSYFSPIWLYSGLFLIVVTFLPQTTIGLVALSGSFSSFVDRSPRNRWLAGVFAAAIVGSICWLGSVGLPLLGDGSLRCREITEGKLWQPTEALDFLAHALSARFLTKPLFVEVTQAYRYISILSGIVYLIGAYQLSRYLTQGRWVIWLIASMGLGVTSMFFGYVESYSIVAALIPWLVLAGIKVADNKLRTLWYGVFVIVAGLFHSAMLLLFGASAVLLIILDSDSRRKWLATRIGLLWIGGGVIAALLIVGKLLNLPIVSTYALPIFPSAGERIAIISLPYLLNVINWVLLSGLTVIPLAIWSRTGQSRHDQPSRRLFAFSLIIPAIIFILIFPPKLGGPIDWDLFSLPLAVMAFALLSSGESGATRELPRWIVPILAVALINTTSFVAVNHSITMSAERFSRIIPLSASPNPWIHWSSLVVHAEHQPDLFDRRNEFLLKSWQAPPNNKRDSVTTLTKLMRESVLANDSLSTRSILSTLNSIAGLPPEVLASETDAFIKFGSPDEQLGFAEMLASAFPSSPIALGAAGVLFMNLGEVDRCGGLLARSYALDSTNFRVALNYGVYLANKQDFLTATSVLKRASRLDESSFFAAYYLANSLLAQGDIAGAKAAMLRAEANALRPEEQERIKQLKMRF